MGTPDFALSHLIALNDAGHDIVAVYCQPPKQKGRGFKVTKNPTHIWAEENGIPVYTPLNFKNIEDINTFQAHNADVAVVAAYGLLLPKEILDAPAMGCINIHASLLPRWRGAAPIHRALMSGDTVTGITTMLMDEGLDTGHMLETSKVAIGPSATVQELHDNLATLGARLILSTITGLLNRTIVPVPQPQTGITYAHKLQKEEGFLNFSLSAHDLVRMIRALVPQISVWVRFENVQLKVLEVAFALDEFSVAYGTVVRVQNSLFIQCGKGSLRILKLQAEGGKPLLTEEFLRGLRAPSS